MKECTLNAHAYYSTRIIIRFVCVPNRKPRTKRFNSNTCIVTLLMITSSTVFVLCSRRGSSERLSRLTSAVKPLMEASSEAVIDLDDDLIGYDPLEQSLTSRALYSRSTADRSRPALESSRHTADAYRSSDVTRGQERSGSSRGYRSSVESSRVSEFWYSESISSVHAVAYHLNEWHPSGRNCPGNERRL